MAQTPANLFENLESGRSCYASMSLQATRDMGASLSGLMPLIEAVGFIVENRLVRLGLWQALVHIILFCPDKLERIHGCQSITCIFFRCTLKMAQTCSNTGALGRHLWIIVNTVC